MSDWLTFAGPIVLALIAIASPAIASRLRGRDARERIKADIEILKQLEEGSAAQKTMRYSIDRQAAGLLGALPGHLSPSGSFNARQVFLFGIPYTGVAAAAAALASRYDVSFAFDPMILFWTASVACVGSLLGYLACDKSLRDDVQEILSIARSDVSLHASDDGLENEELENEGEPDRPVDA
ncbi:hypothetical protein [Rhodococcoides yunnanense]|uniref:hypothetical protein n=1 Tax=Rhodococcoides yunnanense TaxID=278209 RepID=UPI0009347106|nr:hypothetical protein [Rhodococcus yunnanensis]